MAKAMKHLTFDEFASNLSRVFDQVLAEGTGVVVEKGGARAVFKPVANRTSKQKGGGMAHQEVKARSPLTLEEQQQAFAAIERLKQARVKVLAERGGKPFSPSWQILNALRDERTRELR